MTAVVVVLALSAPAAAQSKPQLVDGTPEFTDCLETETCAANFYGFLGEAMGEQGFTFQHDAMVTSAVLAPARGVVVGGTLSTFPLGPPPENLSGKEENTSFSPVLPRLVVGYGGGDGGDYAWGVGAFFLPPVAVKGASALVAGGDVSAGWGGGDGTTHLGVELDFTYTRAHAPVAATEEQLDNRDDFDNPDNLDPDTYAANCPDGCVDVFSVANTGARFVVAFPRGAWTPYAKAGLSYVSERLDVAYDKTGWAMRGLQPSLHGGVMCAPGDTVLLGLGTALALKHPGISAGGVGAFFKLQGSAAVTF